ncbi:E3 ubiquitin protein ligase [Endozoicomonas sp. SCSIO W0465]|uniref:E3 ubiquitin protein ligase n=1 Tax=Endozoicomonas sp. SCSIO W0465 TaxID=2918516 RepID=UPI0020764A3C|nr:E3 ubiquitin protein ligase [Endozoicomonas sp. SCSIO W0465]USE39496.1 E3 ubiquitin protein ligase [Endozoicomonas sp. SCSIO W0465]
MDTINGFGCLICHDAEQCSPFKLTCGHAFGRSCMQGWMELSGQKKCLLCTKPLTDDEVKQFINSSLFDRMVSISSKAIPIFGKTIKLSLTAIYGGLACSYAMNNEPLGSDTIIGATAIIISTASIGALGVAAGVSKVYGVSVGTAVGACAMVAVKHVAATYGVSDAPTANDFYMGAIVGSTVTGAAYDLGGCPRTSY